MLDNNFWESDFDITINDIKRLYDLISNTQYPVSLIDLAKKVISGRLKYGEDLSPTVLSDRFGKQSIKLWDPAGNWSIGDNVIVVGIYSDSNNDSHQPYVGVITKIDLNSVCIKLEDFPKPKHFLLATPDSEEAIHWHNFVRQIVAKYAGSSKLEDRVTAVFTEFGGKIASRLQEALATDNRFITLNQYWFLSNFIEDISRSELIGIYKFISESNKPLSLDEISNHISFQESDALIQQFRIKKALSKNPNFFTEIDTKDGILYKLSVPDIDNTQIVNFAYDPETYEIICAPGEKPSQKTVDKLNQHGLLVGVIGSQVENVNGLQN